MRTKLLFFCDISPSTVMLRRSTVEENQLYFDPQRQCPDWELWFRAAELTDIETIPQALSAEYVPWEWPVVRDDARIQEEMSELAAERLKEGIKLDLLPEKRYLLGGWINVFSSMDPLNREDALWELNEILFEAGRVCGENKKKYLQISVQKLARGSAVLNSYISENRYQSVG